MRISVDHNRVLVTDKTPLVRGTVGDVVDITYVGDEWVGLSKTAVFTNGTTVINMVNASDNAVIPHEVLDIVGARVRIGIYGYRTEDDEIVRATPTYYADLGSVLDGADPSGDEEVPPTPTQIQQLEDLVEGAVISSAEVVDGDLKITVVNGDTYNAGYVVGPQGEQGEKGDKGDKGDTGDTGPAGATGPKGDKGDKGDTGAKGDKGDKGDTGSTGATGPQGPKGDTGAAFTYEMFTPEQLAALKGPKGDKGDTGNTGATGAAGPQGPQGATGATGAQGPAGPQGNPGTDGTDGEDGYSPTVTVTTITGGHRVTITDASGDHVFDVMDGQDGEGAVSSVNGQTGDVMLDAEDVGALPDDTVIPSALADLTDDSTHRTVTDAEKSAWSDKQDAIGYTPYNATNPAGYQTAAQVSSAVASGVSGKQDTISDLATIRSGAALGATALQSVPSTYRTASAQDTIDAGKQPTISDLATIRSNASDGHTAYTMLDGVEALLAAI